MSNRRMMKRKPGDLNYITYGKGDRPRFGDKKRFDDNYDEINWKSKQPTSDELRMPNRRRGREEAHD